MKNRRMSSEKGKPWKKNLQRLFALIMALFLALPVLSQSALQLSALSYVSWGVSLNATPAPGTKVESGMIIEYTLNVFNPGINMAEDLYVRDYIPAGTHYVADSVSEYGSYVDGPNGAYLQWTIPELAGNEGMQLYFQVCVDDSSADLDVIENRALYEMDFDPHSAGDPRTVTNHVYHPVAHPEPTEPLIMATLDSSPDPGESVWNSDITYRVHVTNFGTAPAHSVVARCYIPEGAEYVKDSVSPFYKGIYREDRNYVQWIIYDIYPEEEAELSFTVHVEREDGQLIRCVGLFEENFDPEVEEDPRNLTNVVEHTTPIVCYIPSTIVTGETDPAEDVERRDGDMITYTVNVENINGGQGEYVRIRDYIPEGTLYMEGTATDGGQYVYDPLTNRPYVEWLLSDLPDNGERQVSFRVIVTPEAYELPGKTIDNQILYEVTDNPDGTENLRNHLPWTKHPVKDPGNDARSVVYLDSDPIPGTRVRRGDVITYQLRAVNTGYEAVRSLVVRDEIPAGTVYVEGSASDGGMYREKPIPPGSRDPQTQGEVRWVIDELAPMEERTLSFQVEVDSGYIYDRIRNAAYYESDFDPESEGNPKYTTNIAEHPVVDPPGPWVPPAVFLEADPVAGTRVQPGDHIRYVVTVVNANKNSVPLVRLRDYIPRGTSFVEGSASGSFRQGENEGNAYIEWWATDIPADSKEYFTFEVVVEDSAYDDTEYIQNHVFHETIIDMPLSVERDPQNVSNRVVHPVERPEEPNIFAQLTSQPVQYAEVRTGDIISYSIDVRNDGGTAENGLVVENIIPQGTSYVEGSVSGDGYFDEKLNRVLWVYDTYPAYSNDTLSFQVRVEPSYDDGTNLIQNKAYFWEGDLDYFGPIRSTGHWHNHKIADPVDVNSIVAVYKDAVPVNGTKVASGDVITYRLAARNTGRMSSPYVRVRDYIPRGTTYVEGSANEGGTYFKSERGDYVEWIVFNIPSGSEKVLTFRVTVDRVPPKSIQNRALYEATFRHPVMPGSNQKKLADPSRSTNQTRHYIYYYESFYISSATVSGIRRSYVYSGFDIEPVPILTYRGRTLTEGQDYTVSYLRNRNAGTASVTITGMGNFAGRVTKNFTIMKKAFSSSWVSGIASSYTYTGSDVRPEPVVKWGGKTLVKGVDYTVTYSNNRAVGRATVRISGKGNYSGTVTKSFQINSRGVIISTVKPGKRRVIVNWSIPATARTV